MEIVKNIGEYNSKDKTAVALGVFDGVHLGHQKVIESAKGLGLKRTVLTFEGIKKGLALSTPEDKLRLLENIGVEKLCVVNFLEIKDMEPEVFFAEVLVKRLNAGLISCGEGFRFGKGAKGDTALLKALCSENGMELVIVPAVLLEGEKVSSTAIREALKNGDVKKANRMLGRPFGFKLEVIHGNHIGTGLGTPTVNQAIPEGFILPKFGVYASVVKISEQEYQPGVTNIGVKPTVGSDKVLSETWMPEFKGDLYGRNLRVQIIDFIRPERKFDSLEEMKAEILNNAIQAKEITAGLVNSKSE